MTGALNGSELRVGIAVARFNELVTKPLLAGTIETLIRYGVFEDSIDVGYYCTTIIKPFSNKLHHNYT